MLCNGDHNYSNRHAFTSTYILTHKKEPMRTILKELKGIMTKRNSLNQPPVFIYHLVLEDNGSNKSLPSPEFPNQVEYHNHLESLLKCRLLVPSLDLLSKNLWFGPWNLPFLIRSLGDSEAEGHGLSSRDH